MVFSLLSRTHGGGLNFISCFSHLTIDHASRSKRSTVPTPNRDTSNIGALNTFFPCYIETVCLSYPLPVSPSVVTICLLGWRSLSCYYLVYLTSPCHVRLFSSSLAHPVPPRIFHILPPSEFYSLLLATRAHTCIFLLSTTGLPFSSFWQVQVPYTKPQFQRFRVVHWAVQNCFHSHLFF